MLAEEAKIIYVLSEEGKPLMPTKRTRHIAKLLKWGKARVISRNPFVVQMKYEVGKETQPLYGGTDPGRTNIANAVVDENGNVVYKDHVTSNNKDVPKHMKERASNRRASRRGERLRRKRRAKKNNTLKAFPEGRILPGCKEPISLKDIINSKSRFNNRKRRKGWLTPTARHLKETHINQIKNILKILPVTEWTLEINKFAFMEMEDGTIKGVDFQNGRMKGFKNVNDYIDHIQKGKCACCKGIIEHHHHITPRSKGGSNLPDNIVGLCSDCHNKVHTNKLNLNAIGERKKYNALSVLNQGIPYIYKELESIFGETNVYGCSGKDTETLREIYHIEKTHANDAVCIASIYHGGDIQDNAITHEVVQFRRHNRANINNQRERTYYLDGNIVAKNRKPRFEQKEKALSDLNLAREEISRLVVKKSQRHYNNKARIMPGAEFVYEGNTYILTGTITNGKYYRAYGQGKMNFPAAKCIIKRRNRGLMYV